MSQALSASEYIYQGVWVNWNKDKGVVLGSTLTVNSSFASILSPALAIFISIAGSQLWRLFQFGLHQARATSDARGLIYHQQQVILRNTGTDLNTIYRFIRTAIAWRHQKDAKVLKTSFPLVFWSVVHFSLIVLAGLFSSWLLEAGDDVLSRSPWCGNFNQTYGAALTNASQQITDQGLHLLQEYAHYHNARYAYVKQHIDICQNGENGTEGCDMMPAQSLGWTARVLNGACPFDGDMCHEAIEGSLSLDTGYISSSKDLGFNAAKNDRIALRLSAQCAPLNDAKYETDWQQVPAVAGVPAHEVVNVLYGPSITNSQSATFSQVQQTMSCDQRISLPAYFLNSVFAAANGSSGNFQPISGLQKGNADVSLISLVSNSLYIDPVLDPWFSAQEIIDDLNAFCLGDKRTVYGRERPITTMGCTQQWQLCNTESPESDADEQCTAFMGLTQLQEYLVAPSKNIALNSHQLASANRVLGSAVSSSFYYVINALASSSGQLSKAASQMASNTGPALPVDQWQIETKNWMDIMLGILQQTSLDFGTGQFVASTAYINATEKLYKTSPNDPEVAAAQWLCENQIIHSKVYTNYNFFALMLLVTLCLILIVLGMCIEDVIGHIRQRSLRHSSESGKHDMWNANSDLEMLKTIDELRNNSTWGMSKNGMWLGPPGYKISINDLKADSYDVEKGRGLVTRAVKKRLTEHDMSRSSPVKRGLTHCKTCSSSSSDESSLRKATPTDSEKAQFKFQSTFERGFDHDFPLVRVAEVSNPSIASSEETSQATSHYQETQRTKRFPVIPTAQGTNERTRDLPASTVYSGGHLDSHPVSILDVTRESMFDGLHQSSMQLYEPIANSGANLSNTRRGFWNLGLNRVSRSFVQ